MSIAEPDALDCTAQLGLEKRLSEIRIPNPWEALLSASAQVRGHGIARRFVKAAGRPARLSPHEFVYYRLFDPALPEEEIPRFISARARRAHSIACNNRDWAALTFDKVLWDSVLGAVGLPRPALRAVYRTGVPARGVRRLDDRDALLAYLRDPEVYPLIAKPSGGGRSIGLMRLEALEGDAVRLHDDSLRRVEDVAAFIHDLTRTGYMFQEVLRPHPEIARLTGGSVATVRAFVLFGPGGAQVENITLKLPRTGAVADNYWRAGNMIGAVDARTGEIRRVVTGSGLDLKVLDAHPGTGVALNGLRLPDLDALVALCQQLAPVFRGIRLQGWDIALTDRGPVPVEVNFGGDVNLQQLAHNAGGMTPAYCAHLRACGFKGRLPE